MPYTLVRDVLGKASLMLQDVKPQFNRWTEYELVGWLNDGQVAIAKYLPMACSRVDAVKLQPGTRQSIAHIAQANVVAGDPETPVGDVYGNFLNDIVRNMGADGRTPGAVVRVMSREAMDLQNPMWHTAPAAASIENYSYDPRTPKVFYVSPPVQSTAPVWVEISLLANPAPVPRGAVGDAPRYKRDGNDTTTISVDDKYVDDLLNYILARAYMKDAEYAENAQNIALYAQQFVSSLNSQVAALTGQNPNLKALPLSPSVPAAAS